MASPWREVSGQPRCTVALHGCVKAAVINAVYALPGTLAADVIEEVKRNDTGVYHNFGPLRRVFQRTRETVIACGVAREDKVQGTIQPADRWAAFRELVGSITGVFIGRLLEVRRVDQAVVVDANTRVIMDSEGATAIELSAQNLVAVSRWQCVPVAGSTSSWINPAKDYDQPPRRTPAGASSRTLSLLYTVEQYVGCSPWYFDAFRFQEVCHERFNLPNGYRRSREEAWTPRWQHLPMRVSDRTRA